MRDFTIKHSWSWDLVGKDLDLNSKTSALSTKETWLMASWSGSANQHLPLFLSPVLAIQMFVCIVYVQVCVCRFNPKFWLIQFHIVFAPFDMFLMIFYSMKSPSLQIIRINFVYIFHIDYISHSLPIVYHLFPTFFCCPPFHICWFSQLQTFGDSQPCLITQDCNSPFNIIWLWTKNK